MQWHVAAQFRSVASPKGQKAKQYTGRRRTQGNSCVCKADRPGRRCQVQIPLKAKEWENWPGPRQRQCKSVDTVVQRCPKKSPSTDGFGAAGTSALGPIAFTSSLRQRSCDQIAGPQRPQDGQQRSGICCDRFPYHPGKEGDKRGRSKRECSTSESEAAAKCHPEQGARDGWDLCGDPTRRWPLRGLS